MGKWLKSMIIGVITGFLNGLFGSGGGTVAVPSMQKFLGVETHKSHATAIAIILPLSIASSAVYFKGTEIDWKAAAFISIGGMAGGFIGAKLLNKISSGVLHKIFGIFMAAAALRMII